MAKKVRSKPADKPGYPTGYLMFHDIHQYMMRKYPKETVGSYNECLAFLVLEQDANTRAVHPGIDTEPLEETLDRVVMGRKDQSQTNTLVRVCAMASAFLQQNKEIEEKKAKEKEEGHCDCDKCDCDKEKIEKGEIDVC